MFMSDKTLLSFVMFEGNMPFDVTRIPGLLEHGMDNVLRFLDVPHAQVIAAVADLDIVALTKTSDRALMGNLASLKIDYQLCIAHAGGLQACNLTEIILNVNDGPQRRLGWASAKKLTQELLASQGLGR